jgi:putative membrane protein
VLAAGLARAWWGVKGAGWYWSQPLLHFKLTLFIAIGLMSLKPSMSFLRWRRKLLATGELPPPEEVRAARRWVMIETHLLGLLLLAAVLLARGVWTR